MTSVFWTYDTFENNFKSNLKLENYFNEISLSLSDKYFSFKYFQKTDFVR